MFKRKLYDRMLAWKRESNGGTALLIQGARRVGKSTLARAFAENEYESHILIDFANAPATIFSLFEDTHDLDFFFLQLQAIYHADLHTRKSVIVLDEVQLCPKARQAVKYLVADGRYDYIETGSLISIRKNVKDIVIPSEENRLNLYPLDYEEFRWALGDNVTMELIRHAWENCIPLGAAHRQLMRDFRLYMLVGGMPQAVAAYMETNNFRKVDDAKRGILTLYEEDFRKIDVSGRASQIFSNIPSQLSSNASRYKVASVLPGAKRDRLAEIFSDLQDSHTVLAAYHANDPNVGMALTRDIEYYKIFLLDTGLFTTLVYRDKDYTENDLYVRLLNDKQHTNMGYLYENVVAQMLAAKGDSLFYYTFQTDNNSSRYEVDFLIARQGKLCPLEVKSSGYKTHKSLDAFQEKFSSRISHRYLVYTKDFQKQGDVICLPTYMVPFL